MEMGSRGAVKGHARCVHGGYKEVSADFSKRIIEILLDKFS